MSNVYEENDEIRQRIADSPLAKLVPSNGAPLVGAPLIQAEISSKEIFEFVQESSKI